MQCKSVLYRQFKAAGCYHSAAFVPLCRGAKHTPHVFRKEKTSPTMPEASPTQNARNAGIPPTMGSHGFTMEKSMSMMPNRMRLIP